MIKLLKFISITLILSLTTCFLTSCGESSVAGKEFIFDSFSIDFNDKDAETAFEAELVLEGISFKDYMDGMEDAMKGMSYIFNDDGSVTSDSTLIYYKQKGSKITFYQDEECKNKIDNSITVSGSTLTIKRNGNGASTKLVFKLK